MKFDSVGSSFRHITVILGIALLCLTSSGQATVLKSLRVASGLNLPVFVTSSPQSSATLFALEQHAGLIRIIRNGIVLPRPFLDIHDRVITTGTERGLLGMTFHPDYANNGYFYIDYDDTLGNTVISRFRVTVDPDSADPASEQVLLNIAQPYPNHKGGMLAFGPNDGYLYIGMGDGGSGGDPENRAQNDNELLGKLLRIDINHGQPYAIPATNPFVGMPGKRQEIWAKGLRNPWRYSFDRANGNLIIGDVGQDLWEEIDFEAASSLGGQNFGWRIMEGFHCFNPPANCDTIGLTMPIYEYGHNIGCAITGGYIYRGGVMPNLKGTYFFADFCANKIWSFRYDNGNIGEFAERTNELAPATGQPIASISSFGEDRDGEIHVVDLNDGEIFKIIPASPSAIGGIVTDDSGLAVAGAIVSVLNTAVADTTDSTGHYLLNGLGDGAFDISFTHFGFRDTTLFGVTVGVGDTVQANISFTTGLANTPLPFAFRLYQNYPNPFNTATNIEYDLGRECNTKIEIFDIRGDQAAILVNAVEPPGHHRVAWNATEAPSGVYFYRIVAGQYAETKKLVLLK
jgi:glucose/arabinose dehydrogenase